MTYGDLRVLLDLCIQRNTLEMRYIAREAILEYWSENSTESPDDDEIINRLVWSMSPEDIAFEEKLLTSSK